LSWDAVIGAAQYHVQARENGSATWINLGTVTTNAYNYTGLTNCTNYEFQIAADCGSGMTNYSVTSTFSTTGCTPTVCDKPVNIVKSSSGNTVTLSWDADANAIRTQIQIRVKPNQAGTVPDMQTAFANGVNTKTLTYDNANCGFAYQARLRHVCSVDNTLRSPWKIVQVIPTSCGSRLGENVKEEIQLYPNPVENNLTIVLDNFENEIKGIFITDLAGRALLVHETTLLNTSDEAHLIDVSKLVGGIYFLNVQTSEGITTKKFVKK
jgi:hypothetical protein